MISEFHFILPRYWPQYPTSYSLDSHFSVSTKGFLVYWGSSQLFRSDSLNWAAFLIEGTGTPTVGYADPMFSEYQRPVLINI